MRPRKSLCLLIGVALSATFACANNLTYVCGSGISTATCDYLNGTIADLYDSTFTNATATIYIATGDTSLGESTTALNFISYSNYLQLYSAESSGDSTEVAALSALNTYDTPAFCPGGLARCNAQVEITSALGEALKIQANQLNGVDDAGNVCDDLASAGCYAGDITVSSTASLYYRTGYIGSAYDFFSVVEHETDEVLGTASCMSTADSTRLLTDPCGGSTPSAVDLFRYNGAGKLALNSSYIGLAGAPIGAFFSFNGGATNGADGAVYNTLANGLDYADLGEAACQYAFIQGAVGCPGLAGIDITNDGPGGTAGPEITILNAVGYNESAQATAAPEPGTLSLLSFGMGAAVILRRRRRPV